MNCARVWMEMGHTGILSDSQNSCINKYCQVKGYVSFQWRNPCTRDKCMSSWVTRFYFGHFLANRELCAAHKHFRNYYHSNDSEDGHRSRSHKPCLNVKLNIIVLVGDPFLIIELITNKEIDTRSDKYCDFIWTFLQTRHFFNISFKKNTRACINWGRSSPRKPRIRNITLPWSVFFIIILLPKK